MTPLEPSLPRHAAELRRRAVNMRLRNSDGTFRKNTRSTQPRSARGGKTRAPSKAKPKGKIMRIIMAILHEAREFLWSSDSEEMGIKRGYRDGRDQA